MNSQILTLEPKTIQQITNDPQISQLNHKTSSLPEQTVITFNHQVIVQKKKKKKIIHISSSESEPQIKCIQQSKIQRQNLPLQKPQKNKKIKKAVLRCHLCKASGKRSEMKLCLICRNKFHMSCIENDSEVPKKYICDKCRFARDEQIKIELRREGPERKLVSQQVKKMILKKSQKEKKKQEYQKRQNEFSSRYPYYIQQGQKFKFPIQDKLLIIYREIFDQNNETLKPKPKPHPLIPHHMLADFLQIENFFSTFKEELKLMFGVIPKNIKKDFLYLVMNSEAIDQIYSNMIFCLLKIYLCDIFDKNKTDNVKMLNQNSFFTLLTNMNQNEDLNQEVIVKSAQQIIRYLATIPSMKKSFEGFVFPSTYNRQTKVYILISLIKGLSEVDTFHQFVAAKSQKMQNFTKEKGELVNKLKTDEAQNLSNKEKIKEYANAEVGFDEQLNKNQENGLSVSTRQITRQKDKNKKKLQKLATQKDKSEKNIQEIRAQISEISKMLPFVTSQVVFIGRDRNQSHYFFYCCEPNRIYCRYRNFLLDDSEGFYVYDGKLAINELQKSLNPKGLHQKHLSDVITSFIKEQIIVDKSLEDGEDTIKLQLQLKTKKVYQKVGKQQIVLMIEELEQMFTNYLLMKDLQWAPTAQRKNYFNKLKNEQKIQQIKQMIILLQQSFLFVEPISMDEFNGRKFTLLDSDEQQKEEKKESRKKSPVRLWGINSERIKKYWIEYLEQSIDYQGVWICTTVLKNYVDRYVKKKMEFLLEQQKKDENLEMQKERHRLRRETYERDPEKMLRERSREKRNRRGRPGKLAESSQEILMPNRPNLRERKKRRFQIDSDIENEEEGQDDKQEEYCQEESESEDKCEICGEYGEMICCDGCPKVFHLECLKIKEIPQGDWICVKCLEKIANQRQTRSRVTKISKQPYI